MFNMDQATYESLTDRQRECLRLVARDRDSKEIARLLGKSPETVNAHIKASLAKLSYPSRFVAARELAAFEERHPWLVNQPRGIANERLISDQQPVDYAVRSERTSPAFRDGQAVFAMPTADPLPAWIDGQGGSTTGALRRLTLAAALTVLLALAIVAAVPMSDAFERLADLLRPYLNR
jgi:DNA-binding CsgD family transcriptional regulator